MAIEAHAYIIAQQPTDPAKWVILEKFQGRFCTPRTIIGMVAVMEASSKRKRSRSPPSRRVGKSSGGSKNPSVTCNLFNKGKCGWANCQRAHKCKGFGSKGHGLPSCLRAKKAKEFSAGSRKAEKRVEIIKIASANGNSLHQFVHRFSVFICTAWTSLLP